jgi:hypothetical protein
MMIDQTDRVNHSSNRHYNISRGKFLQNCPQVLASHAERQDFKYVLKPKVKKTDQFK